MAASENKNIIRVQKNRDNPYVMMNKTGINDPRLSFKAKGILAYLLSKPDNWKVMIIDLINHSTDGKTAIYSGLKELEKYGYLERKRIYVNGKVDHWENTIYEVPIEKGPEPSPKNRGTAESIVNEGVELLPENLKVESLKQEKQPLIINDNNNNDFNNNSEAKNPKEDLDQPHLKESSTDVVITELKNQIDKVTEGKITKKRVKSLINNKGIDHVKKYIGLFDSFKKSQDISDPVGFFIRATENEWEPASPTKRNLNAHNFEQRIYADNDLEHLFEDIS